jgi:hypothetical protein
MPLEPGGYAEKLGNRYEGRWGVRQLLRLLSEELVTVTIEPLGDDEHGVDLWIERRDGSRQGQQCKHHDKPWTLADLSARGVLRAACFQLDRDPSYEFALISPSTSPALGPLCESARQSSGDAEQFYELQVQAISEDRRLAYRQFCGYLGLGPENHANRALAYGYLRRMFIECWPDSATAREDLLGLANVLVVGDPATVLAVLAGFVQDNLRMPITAPAVWHNLKSHGLQPRHLPNDTRILPAVEELRQQFADSIKDDLIAGAVIPRKETSTVLEALRDGAVVVLHGSPGRGKSGVLYELIQRFRDEKWVYLPVRLDRQEPRNTPRQFGQDLGLPESPVKCLEAVAGPQRSVLVLDQLDAIRWTSRHSLNALEVCKSLVREVKSLRDLGKRIGVVLACRTYDLDNDPSIKAWLAAENAGERKPVRIEVAPLDEQVVADVVQRQGHAFSSLSKRQKGILQSPQHLAMWVRLVQSGGAPDFQNRVELMRDYWESRVRELKRHDVSVDDANSLLGTLVYYMESNGSVSAPRSLVANPEVLAALRACGLLQFSGGQITFSHQSYLDFQIATRVVRQIHGEGGTVRGWLGDCERQSLFRREQLRQALVLLHDDLPHQFPAIVRDLLENPEGLAEIRFHLKHLVLETVGQFDIPDPGLLGYMKTLAEKEAWREHVLGTVFLAHPPFVGWLIESGTVARWLSSPDSQQPACWMLRSVSDQMPDVVADALTLYGRSDDEEQRACALGCLCWRMHDDSERMFELRLELARHGTFRDFVEWESLPPLRALLFLEAILSSWTADGVSQAADGGGSKRVSRCESWTPRDCEVLERAARSLPERAWDLVMPHVCRLAPSEASEPYALEQWLDGDRHDIRQGMECIPHGLLRLAVQAGRELATRDGTAFWARTAELHLHPSPVVQYVLMETYAALPPGCADAALQWLLDDRSRLAIGTGAAEPEWMPAARLIEALSPHCDDATFRLLEESITHYHAPNERRAAEFWLASCKHGCIGDFWGRAQHFLLPALCQRRRSDATEGLIGVLERKFCGYPKGSFCRAGQSHFGVVGSTLPTGVPERMSDNAWLALVANKDIPDDGGCRGWMNGHWEESSVLQFSRDLENVAARSPERFARLALRFPEDVNAHYKAAILSGCQQSEPKVVPEAEKALWRPASTTLLAEVLERFGKDDDRSYATGLCRLIQRRASEAWPDEAIDRLVDCATSNPDPVVGNVGGGFDATEATVENLLTNALNAVRGAAALAMGSLLWHHPELLARFSETIAKLVRDPHPAVRVAGVEACCPVLRIDKDQAIEWFCEACNGDLRVAASPEAVEFFNCGITTHHARLAPLVLAMLRSSFVEVAMEGAKEVAARWLFHDYFSEELTTCLRDGTVPQRKGVGNVAACFVTKPEYFSRCAGILDALMDDPELEVRRQVGAAFNRPEVLGTPDGVDLACRFVSSRAFDDNPTTLIHGLESYAGNLLPFKEVVFSMSRQFVGPLHAASRDPSSGVMWDLSRFLPMVMRLYEQATDRQDLDVVNRCLDAWDAMFEKRVGIVHELAKAMD